MCCARNGVVDLVPVDYVNNMLIAVGWITALNRCVCVCVCVVYRVNILLHRTSQPVVYNYNTGTMNPLTIATLCKIKIIITIVFYVCISLDYSLIASYHENPFDDIFRRPYMIHCRPAFLWPCVHFIIHLIPGYLMDSILRIRGKKPM